MDRAEAAKLLGDFDGVDTWNQFLIGRGDTQEVLVARSLTAFHDLLRPLLVVLLYRSTGGV